MYGDSIKPGTEAAQKLTGAAKATETAAAETAARAESTLVNVSGKAAKRTARAAAKATEEAVVKEAGWFRKALGGTGRGLKWTGGRAARGVKGAAIAGAIAGGAALLWSMASGSRKAALHDSENAIAGADLQVPPAPVPMQPDMAQMAMAQQQPAASPQEMGPAEGRAPDEWQQRVAADRGQDMGQAKNPAAQPKMSVVPESSVEQLGSASAPTPPSR